MKTLDKKVITNRMTERLAILEDRMTRDFSGGVQPDVFAIRELKYWLEAINRNEFDIKVWED